MSKKILMSVLVILLAAAAVGGATMAWFTDSEEVDNFFTAGTLDIGVVDGWAGIDGDIWEVVNPGDCKDKKFEITNDGTKNALLRFQFSGEWGTIDDGSWTAMADSNPDLVTVTAPAGWYKHTDDWWYYESGPLAPGSNPFEFALTVCVDGPNTGNKYQGMSYKLDFEFQAIQASNNASGDAWGVNSIYDPVAVMTPANWTGFDFVVPNKE